MSLRIKYMIVLVSLSYILVGQGGLTEVSYVAGTAKTCEWYYLRTTDTTYQIPAASLEHGEAVKLSDKWSIEAWNFEKERAAITIDNKVDTVTYVQIPVLSTIVEGELINVYQRRPELGGMFIETSRQVIELEEDYCDEFCDTYNSNIRILNDPDGGLWLEMNIEWMGCAWGTQTALLRKQHEKWSVIFERQSTESRYGGQYWEYEYFPQNQRIILYKNEWKEFGDTTTNKETIRLDSL